MTEPAFIGGLLIGFIGCVALAGAAAVLLIKPRRQRPQDPIVWTDEAYEPPVLVKTKIVNRHREFEL